MYPVSSGSTKEKPEDFLKTIRSSTEVWDSLIILATLTGAQVQAYANMMVAPLVKEVQEEYSDVTNDKRTLGSAAGDSDCMYIYALISWRKREK